MNVEIVEGSLAGSPDNNIPSCMLLLGRCLKEISNPEFKFGLNNGLRGPCWLTSEQELSMWGRRQLRRGCGRRCG